MKYQSVAAFDRVDPTVMNPGTAVQQPVLLASSMSCHGAGNWYRQAGAHSIRFALTSHAGDWRQVGRWNGDLLLHHA